ncbi:MAG TPA: lysophospholipid acyltransferase family protein [Gaiellaceae bacterium]|nr:lysophospholipid acyltransferase family protein [Gaiellaceae bacterium]
MTSAPPRPSRLYRIVASVSRPVVERLYRLHVQGRENVPAQGGFVVAANHTSNLDPWPLAIALRPRPLHFMAKHEAWRPPLSWVIAAAGSFSVRRGEGDAEALSTAMRLCRDGRVMAMFPEGTRRSKGLRKKHQPRPHSGAARIALGAEVPLIPAALRGMDRLSRLGPLELCFGEAIRLDDLQDLDSHAAAGEATRRLWEAIERLEAELAAEAPNWKRAR